MGTKGTLSTVFFFHLCIFRCGGWAATLPPALPSDPACLRLPRQEEATMWLWENQERDSHSLVFPEVSFLRQTFWELIPHNPEDEVWSINRAGSHSTSLMLFICFKDVEIPYRMWLSFGALALIFLEYHSQRVYPGHSVILNDEYISHLLQAIDNLLWLWLYFFYFIFFMLVIDSLFFLFF